MDCGCNLGGKEQFCMEIVPIFNSLDHHEMGEIASIITSREYQKGQMIYMAGDRVDRIFIIHKGKVKITRLSNSGKEQVIRVLGPGDFMGELSLFANSTMRDNAEVLQRVSLCIVDGDKLKDLIVKYPTIGLKILGELSIRLERAENLIEHLGIHDVETRIVNTIFDMAKGGKEVTLKMSKGDLASHMGMSQETLSRKLSSLQERGLIELVGHRGIIILDKEGLEAIISE
ncbi:MAG: Crp/Fnr family transcriptional regulator [Tissierellia bacterium]|nr:Crp/Fnr family transcriptional regulator [Tissierellia bacterium]